MHTGRLKSRQVRCVSKITPTAIRCPALLTNSVENISFSTPSNLPGPGAASHADVRRQSQV